MIPFTCFSVAPIPRLYKITSLSSYVYSIGSLTVFFASVTISGSLSESDSTAVLPKFSTICWRASCVEVGWVARPSSVGLSQVGHEGSMKSHIPNPVMIFHFEPTSSGLRGLLDGNEKPPLRCHLVCPAHPPETSKSAPVVSVFAGSSMKFDNGNTGMVGMFTFTTQESYDRRHKLWFKHVYHLL
jgi:hypothetical protein